MKTAFYHMAVWNVNEAGDIIKEILEDNDRAGAPGVKPKSVAEKVREKAAIIRRNERLGKTPCFMAYIYAKIILYLSWVLILIYIKLSLSSRFLLSPLFISKKKIVTLGFLFSPKIVEAQATDTLPSFEFFEKKSD